MNRNTKENLFSLIDTDSVKGRNFIKMHGLENHFAIFDGRDEIFLPDKYQISSICDPKKGIGADQVIILEKPTEEGLTAGATVFMRILNVDGREAEACGNATRCVAWLLMTMDRTQGVNIETLAGVLNCSLLENNWVKCEMGRISMTPESIPLSKEVNTLNADFQIGPLINPVISSIGNPHITFFVEKIDNIDIEKWAPKIQADELFPEGVNVGIAEVIDKHNLQLKVYERGAGLTTACGSGACAAVFAANARDMNVAKKMDVIMPAGKMVIEVSDDASVSMSGPVAYSYSGLWQYTQKHESNN